MTVKTLTWSNKMSLTEKGIVWGKEINIKKEAYENFLSQRIVFHNYIKKLEEKSFDDVVFGSSY